MKHLVSTLRDDLLAAGSGFFLVGFLTSAVSFFANGKHVEVAAAQPIAFDHRVHVEDEGLACSDCHAYYERESFSGLPTLSACALCHADAQGESPEEAKVVRAIEAGTEIEWARLFRQPPHVYFSHSRHVVVAGLECTTCHGDIGTSETPPARPHRLTMSECIACHDRSAVVADCVSCHR